MARPLARAALQLARTAQGTAAVEAAAACSMMQAASLHIAARSGGCMPSTSYGSSPLLAAHPAAAAACSAFRWPGSTPGSWRGMFIRTQPTPNDNSLMFVPGKAVMESGNYEFANAREGMKSPLAKKLFTVDGVSSVFFGSDFITITKKDAYTWSVIKPDLFAAIMDFYSSGEPLFTDAEVLAASDTAIHPDDSEVVAMIKELLETRVRPSVQEDGGDIEFKGFEEDTGTVMVKLKGACRTCSSSTITLKSGIENMLMHYIPEVKAVIEAGGGDEDEGGEDSGGSCGTSDKAAPAAAHPMAQHLSP